MLLGYTILYVEDVARSLAFYEVAFGLKRRFLHDGGDYGELNTGTTALACSSRQLMRDLGKNPSHPVADSPCFEIALVTDDVRTALKAALSEGASLVQDVEDMPWGQTTAYVRDPDGFLIELCTPVSM